MGGTTETSAPDGERKDRKKKRSFSFNDLCCYLIEILSHIDLEDFAIILPRTVKDIGKER